MGEGESELRLNAAGDVTAKAKVAALLPDKPDETLRSKRLDQKPYWHLERARIGASRRVAVELIVNGEAVAKQEIEADGQVRDVAFKHKLARSSWVAMRILPSSHTNPVFVTVAAKPIREKASLEWCLRAVDVCWKSKEGLIRKSEQIEALAAYEHARHQYRTRLAEAQ
jgi:hypothetical protein